MSQCVEWPGPKNPNGYGIMFVRGRTRGAHVVALERATGAAVPRGMVVCHRCDNPPCVNPAHLFVGTHKDNWEDSVKKGRNIVAGALSPAEVERIISMLGRPSAAVALEVGRSMTTVLRVWRRHKLSLP